MEYGDLVRTELVLQSKSQAWLAGKLGVSTAAVNQWLRGGKNVPQGRRLEIQALLGWKPSGQIDFADLPSVYRAAKSPMAFLLQEHVPKSLVSQRYNPYLTPGTQEYQEWALGIWSRELGLTGEQLVSVAQRREYLTLGQVAQVFAVGTALTYLGEHVGVQQTDAERVAEWLGSNGPFNSFDDLRDALKGAERTVAHRVAVPRKLGHAQATEMFENGGGALPSTADGVYEFWLETLEVNDGNS